MDLHIWPGSSGIDSFDSDCLVIITYLRLGKCPINLFSSPPQKSDMNSIPLLVHGSNEVTTVHKIIEYLRKENYGLEYELSDEELARLDSLVTSLERRITPAFRWLLWADTNVYNSYTSLLYRSKLPYFYGLWLLRCWRKRIIENTEFSQLSLCSKSNSKNRYKEVESSLFEGARRCLTALSYVLGKKPFFFGERPSAIDAYVFGRLWPLLNYDRLCRKQNSNIHRLISHVYQCENLFLLCRRVQRLCFPSGADSFLTSPASDLREVQATDKAGGWFSSLFKFSSSAVVPSSLLPLRDGLVFCALVLAVSTVFAVGSGIIGFEEEMADGASGPTATAFEDFVDIDGEDAD
uniref:Metaxin n=1 Tax=Mesocestoides corti TaxID=53468 RepID=A0A5K3F6V5_MESCO